MAGASAALLHWCSGVFLACWLCILVYFFNYCWCNSGASVDEHCCCVFWCFRGQALLVLAAPVDTMIGLLLQQGRLLKCKSQEPQLGQKKVPKITDYGQGVKEKKRAYDNSRYIKQVNLCNIFLSCIAIKS